MNSFEELYNVVRMLRGPEGCPWDRVQTHESLKPECIEEAAEVVCGINILRETGSADNLKEELGDLLLQIIFHAQLAEDEGLFSMDDVMDGVRDKMIRRHPHVFGNNAAAAADAGLKRPLTPEEVSAGWEAVKAAEKDGREWEKEYLPDAFKESMELIERARQRKGIH